MFYRRKLLLALIDIFGGSLTMNDCQKLLLLTCQRIQKPYYDFFPYDCGGYSFIVEQDRDRLITLGFLSEHEGFQRTGGEDFLAQLRLPDRSVLQALHLEVGCRLGNDLMRKAYLEYPYYATRSQVASQLLTGLEYEKVVQAKNRQTDPCLFTLGYEGLSIDAYVSNLLANNIRVLIDVRKNPISRKYGFSKKRLAMYVERVGVCYLHLPELGVPSTLRQNLVSMEAYHTLFDYYFSKILPSQEEALRYVVNVIDKYQRVALTCFEMDYQCCHRHKIIDYLKEHQSFNETVIHLK